MFWFPLLPSIPLVIYKQLSSPVVITAIFTLFQFATFPGWKWESQPVALYLQLAEHQAPLQHHGPILRLLVAMEAAQHSTLTDWEMLGDYSSFDRDVPMLSCKLTPRTISFWLSGRISFALCKTTRIMTFASYEDVQEEVLCIWIHFSLSFAVPCPWLFCMQHKISMYALPCFVMFSSRSQKKEKVGDMDSPLLNFPDNPGGRLAHSWPWEAASAQMLQSFRAGQTKHMLMHRHSDKAVFSPLQRSVLKGGKLAAT